MINEFIDLLNIELSKYKIVGIFFRSYETYIIADDYSVNGDVVKIFLNNNIIASINPAKFNEIAFVDMNNK
jgi:hypothetical protein